MNILEKIEKFILYATVFLAPLMVLTLFANPYSPTKLTILALGVSLILLIKAIRVISERSLEISTGSFDLPVLFLLVVYVVSAILKTPNKMEAFFIPGTATVVVCSTLLYFFINNLKEKGKKTLSSVVFLSGVTMVIIFLLAFSKTFALIPQLPPFIQDRFFNPLGGLLPLAIFLATVIPLGINQVVSQKEIAKKIFSGLAVLILVLSLVLAIYNILPGKPTEPRLLDFKTSWAVTIETLKESPLLGIGTNNFLTAFNRFRPLSYNLTDNWAVKFSTARNFYLTALTETGLVGMAAIILILSIVFRMAKKQIKEKKFTTEAAFLISLIILLILFAFFTATPINIMLFFILLALVSKSRSTTLNFSSQAAEKSNNPLASRIPSLLVVLPVIAVLIIFTIFSSRVLIAEVKYRKALDALIINDGLTTYETLRETINTNPYVDRYHATYSQVNLALANSLALNEDLTDQDRSTIAQLVQQAIEEAKATVSLNVTRAGNWEVLARTYQSIAPFAEGADQFSIQSFNQAISLDPISPNLRIALGGIYYSLGDYDSAIETFKMATLAKNDYANAHYNLAFAYREKGETEKAIQEMKTVLTLVDPESGDYELAKTELENLEHKNPSEEMGSETLTPPQSGEATGPQIELPEDLAPPATESSINQ